ncbi:MAG: hypothetical protein AAGH46_08605 [Bacteroidota bacterium]
MRVLATLITTFLLFNCVGQAKKREKTLEPKFESMIEVDSLQRPDDAFKMNMGFDDLPSWIWVKFDNHFSLEDKEFKHIYGINFWDERGFLDKVYYEQDRELKRKEITDFENFIINKYPGDKTFQLVSKKGDTLYLFNVLENKDYRRNFKGKPFQRIPTIRLNNLNQKVSGFDIEINIEAEKNGSYLVTTIDENGIEKRKYQSSCEIDIATLVFSYFDTTNNRVYLLDKDCFLEEEIKD